MGTRRFNVKFLVMVVGLGSLLGAGASLVYQTQLGRTVRALLREAELASARGDNPGAVQAFQRYLVIRPRSFDVLERYGLVLAQGATDARTQLQTYLTLEQVLRQDPTRREVRRRLVDVAMDLGRHKDARTH